MKLQPAIRMAVLAMAAAAACRANGIIDIVVRNNSSADFALDTGTRLREFRTEATTPSAGTLSGDSVIFTNYFAWMNAHRVEPGGPTVALLNSALVSYDLAFTVEDPLNLGYALTIDSVFRGYLTADWDSNSGTGVSQVFAAGTLMSASFDSGGGFNPVTALATTIDVVTATDTTPFANLLVSDTGSYDAGVFTGTRTFLLRFSSVGSNTQAAFQNFNTGETNVRFGLDPTLTGFQNATYPGADGEAASEHGHFVTVSARYLETSAVPEPGTAGFFAVGGALLLLGRVSIRRRG